MNNIIFLIVLLLLLIILKFSNTLSYFAEIYNGIYWDKYRLGDIFYQNPISSPMYTNLEHKENLLYHIDKYPNSIASEYIKQNKNKIQQNFKLLNQIIESKIKNEKLKTIDFDNSTILIHIRTGDILCDYSKGSMAKCYAKIGDTEWWNEVISIIKDQKIKYREVLK